MQVFFSRLLEENSHKLTNCVIVPEVGEILCHSTNDGIENTYKKKNNIIVKGCPRFDILDLD